MQLRLTEQPDYLKNHKADKTFYKDYRKKLHANLGMDDSFSSECSEKSPKKIHQVRLKLPELVAQSTFRASRRNRTTF